MKLIDLKKGEIYKFNHNLYKEVAKNDLIIFIKKNNLVGNKFFHLETAKFIWIHFNGRKASHFLRSVKRK